MSPVRTPSQTVGPFLSLGLEPLARSELVPAGAPGAVEVEGFLFDGAGNPVPDGVVELFQADGAGVCFGRSITEASGRFSFRVPKPAPIPLDTGELQAPHLELLVFARGLLRPLRTRCYFPDEEAANALDPVLAAIEEDRRATLVAAAAPSGGLRFDVRLQGERETVFFGC